jgi:hypothetical protein
VQTAPLTVTAGLSQIDTVLINRTSFAEAVAVTGTSDAGITVTANPSPTTGNQTVLTVAVEGFVSVGTHSVLLTATSGATVVTKTFAVEVKAPAPVGSAVVAMFLDPLAAEFTPVAGNFFHARLINVNGSEVAPSTDGGVIRFSSSDATVMTIDSASGLAETKNRTSAHDISINATYMKGGQTVATAPPSPVTVYPAGTPNHMGAVQIVMLTGDPRKIAIGTSIAFEVVVRDRSGIKQLTDSIFSKLEVSTSSSTALSITTDPRGPNGEYRFTMHANAFPATSAITGIPNVVTVKGDIIGAMSTIGMIIVPASAQEHRP